MEDPKYRLAVGIPTYGKPDRMFTIESLGSLMWHLGRHHPEIEIVHLHVDVRTYRQEARKGIVEAAKENKCTHLLMLDDDHVFDEGVFDKIWEHKEKLEKGGMVSALYMTRGLPCAPCMFRLTSRGTVPIMYYDDNTMMEVDVVGFGFVLFNMDVFERINPPWFSLSLGFGEDAAFCARVLQAGMKVYCHTGAKVGHIHETPYVITEGDFFATREQFYANKLETPKLQFIGTDDGGSRKGQVDSGPWWRPKSGRSWFLGTKRGATRDSRGTGEAFDAGSIRDPEGGCDSEGQGLQGEEAHAAVQDPS
jgi:hypothetical protein